MAYGLSLGQISDDTGTGEIPFPVGHNYVLLQRVRDA